MQLLFDFDDGNPERKEHCDDSILDEYAFLYTSTAHGNNSDIHFAMTTEDAKKWCASNLSKGVYMGTEWAYFFTTVRNFAFCHWGGNHKTNAVFGTVDLRKTSDNGKWDKKIGALGLKKIQPLELFKILRPHGIDVLW